MRTSATKVSVNSSGGTAPSTGTCFRYSMLSESASCAALRNSARHSGSRPACQVRTGFSGFGYIAHSLTSLAWKPGHATCFQGRDAALGLPAETANGLSRNTLCWLPAGICKPAQVDIAIKLPGIAYPLPNKTLETALAPLQRAQTRSDAAGAVIP